MSVLKFVKDAALGEHTSSTSGSSTVEAIKQRTCFECGCTVDVDTSCCSELDEDDYAREEELLK